MERKNKKRTERIMVALILWIMKEGRNKKRLSCLDKMKKEKKAENTVLYYVIIDE